jgi:hypothetical protein
MSPVRISMAGTENQGVENIGFMATESRKLRSTQKDVKNEDWSSEFIENKGAKKVVLRVYRKQMG